MSKFCITVSCRSCHDITLGDANISIGTLQSVQELQLNGSQNEPEMSYITSKVDEQAVTQAETISQPDNSKVSSPTQPKSLQQEFSLINMNIPNIEVTINLVRERESNERAIKLTMTFDGRR